MSDDIDFNNDEAVAHFCSVTDADDATARHFLAAADGDVEVAVSLFLDGGNATSVNKESLVEESVRAPIQQKRSVLVDEDDYTSSSTFATTSRPFTGYVEPFRNFQNEASPFLGGGSGNTNDERGRRLAELFRPPTEIMFKGGFDAARREAKDQSRWLLVTMHNPSEFPCQMLVRDVWNDASVQDFIRESLVFVFLTVGTGEGDRYSSYYPFEEYPHWALLDPRTGKRVRMGSTVVKAVEMLQELAEYVLEHSLESPSVVNMKRQSPIPVNDLTNEPESKTPHLEQVKEIPLVKTELPEEPGADEENVLTVQFRLPDGKRQRRRFHGGDRVQILFDYVSSVDPTTKDFDILSQNASLLEKRDESLEENNLKNAALTVFLKED